MCDHARVTQHILESQTLSDTSEAFLFFFHQFLNLVQLLATFAFLALLQGDAISTLTHTGLF